MRMRLLILPAGLLLLPLLGGCGEEATAPEGEVTECSYPEAGSPAREVEPPPTEAPTAGDVPVTVSTGVGDLDLSLDATAAPCTVNSFVSLADQGYFDGTECHRLTTQGIFVLQCGDPTGTGTGGPGYSFADEVDESATYPAGTIAMANAGPDTNGSQFFLVHDDTELPPKYTVFGTIDAASVEVLREVADAGTANGAPDGPPKTAVELQEVTVD